VVPEYTPAAPVSMAVPGAVALPPALRTGIVASA
jgi:hypothetical protein